MNQLNEMISSGSENSDKEWIPKKRKRVFRVEKDDNPVLKYYNSEEKKYYKALDNITKNSIKEAEKSVTAINNVHIPLRFKILNSHISDEIKAIAIRKLDFLYELDPSSGEYYKTSSWIESVCSLPIGHYRNLPIDSKSPKKDIKHFLNSARSHMDHTVYGHPDSKEQIIRLLAQWIVNPNSKGMVIGIHGPMGCGKTTLIKDSICEVLGLPFAFIPLGGTSDSSYLEGHSYTYEGATWGKIVDTLIKCKCMNPVFYFDELDKVSTTSKGDEIINILIHLTDSSQNDKYHDKYFTDFDFDLSKSLIIFSYNHEENINPILRDRMVRIETKGYNSKEKMIIVEKHMLPIILKEYQFEENDITFDHEVLLNVIQKTEDEDGVRNLKRSVETIVSHINLQRLTEDKEFDFPYSVTKKDVDKYIHYKKENNLMSSLYT